MAKKVILQGRIEENLRGMIELVILELQRLYGYELPELAHATDFSNFQKFLEVLDDDSLSLEKVMTQLGLNSEVFERPPPFYGYGQNGRVHYRSDLHVPLIELVAVTISKALEGPPCSKHRKLAESLRRGDIVFSFNYDLLMDNALRNSRKLTDDGYVVPFQASDGQEWSRPDNASSDVTLFKLHGSMNWLHCSHCGSYFLIRYEKMVPWYASLPRNCPKCGIIGEFLERVIVPPILTKDKEVTVAQKVPEGVSNTGKAVRHISIGEVALWIVALFVIALVVFGILLGLSLLGTNG
jgi:hypothetical protein